MDEEIEKYKTLLLEYVARDRAIRSTSNFVSDFDNFCEEKNHAIEQILRELDLRERKLRIKNEYLELIISIGCDYDGFENEQDLKHLIDELVETAKKAHSCDDTTPIYGLLDKQFNILMEEL